MDFPFYIGDGKQAGNPRKIDLPVPQRDRLTDPCGYLADQGLADAANVALLLSQPLLLTGEPGTGKTVFADSLAAELGLLPVKKFETKSTSTAQDLFYTYDALKRFQHAQSSMWSKTKASTDESALPYITYGALGKAILGTLSAEEMAPYLLPGTALTPETRSVVLIDEIDKAPRDFPNDILNEIEHLYFRVPELGDLGNRGIKAKSELEPVIVITSNSEKDLPEAFLRRCVYYDIPFPGDDRLREIVDARLGLNSAGSSDFITSALDLFKLLRSPSSGLRKYPATAELLGWVLALRQMAPAAVNPLADPNLVLSTLSVLVKNAEDQNSARRVVEEWAAKPRK